MAQGVQMFTCHWKIVKYIYITIVVAKKSKWWNHFFQYEEDYMYKLAELRAWQMHLFIQCKSPALEEKNVSTAWDTK